MKVLAMLYVPVHILDDVFGKGRSQEAAIAESAMPEFGAALKPGHDLVAQKKLDDFGGKLFFSGRILVYDFAIV